MQNGTICLNLVEDMWALQQSWAEPWYMYSHRQWQR
jgi:hypothetical protein